MATTTERNTSGPANTYGCTCVSRNAFSCSEIRDDYREQQERCECFCHNWQDEDDEHGEDATCALAAKATRWTR